MMIEADPKTQETQSVTFPQAIDSCYRKTLTLRGCTSRGEYWRFFLFFIVFFLGTGLLPLDLFELAETLWFLGGTVTNLALNTATVRRLHDIGRSGWWFWIWPISGAMFLLPFVDSNSEWLWLLVAPGIWGIALMIQWLAMPGIDTANNKYAKEEEKEKEKEKAELGSWKE